MVDIIKPEFVKNVKDLLKLLHSEEYRSIIISSRYNRLLIIGGVIYGKETI